MNPDAKPSPDPAAFGSFTPDELAGLAGRMTIDVADGAHSYEFEYTIAETP